MALRSCLSLVILNYVVQCSSHRELNGKYRPYGSLRCIQMYQIQIYRCQKDSQNKGPAEEAFICLDGKDVNVDNTASSTLTRTPKECSPVVRKTHLTRRVKTAKCSAVKLLKACKEGSLDVVRDIVSRGLEDINCQGKYGTTPVMEAVQNAQLAVFHYLVSQGCDLSASDDDGKTVLHAACAGGNTDIVLTLVDDMNIELESRDKFGNTPVMVAGIYCHVKVVRLLDSKCCNFTTINKANDNILHHACKGSCVNVVRYIFSNNKISIESKGQGGQTPVMAAASTCNIHIVKLLATKGCNLTEVDSYDNNILHYASHGGCVNVVRYTLSNNILSIESRGEEGRTPVMSAAENCQIATVKFLAAKGCNLTEVDSDKDNILHIASIEGCVNVITYILSNNIISIESRGLDGQTPVLAAVENCEIEAVKLLAAKGCDLTVVDRFKKSIQHVALMSGCENIVSMLCQKIQSTFCKKVKMGEDEYH